MRLLKYELYKIFSNKFMYLGLVIFIALNFICIHSEYNMKSCRETYKPFKGYEGKISDEKIELAKKYKKYIETQPEDVNMGIPELSGKSYYTIKVSDIECNKDNYLNSLKSYEKEINNATINPLEKTQYELIKKMGYNDEIYYTLGWDKILYYNSWTGFFFIGALIVLGLSSIFAEEYDTFVDSLILTSKYGKSRLVWAKIGAAFIYTVFVVLALYLLPFIFYGWKFGLKGFDVPIRNANFYSQSTINLKIWQFYIVQILFNIVGGFSLGLFTLLISSISKNKILTAFVSGCAFLIPDLLQRLDMPFQAFFTTFSYTNFISLEYLNFHPGFMKNFLGVPIYYEYIMLIIIFVIIVISSILIFCSFRKGKVS